MIIRNFGLRHGRQALSAPPSAPSSCLRLLSTQKTTTTTTTTAVAGNQEAMEQLAALSATHAAREARLAAKRQQHEIAEMPSKFKKFIAYQKQTEKLGSEVERRYLPDEIIRNPPHDASLEELMAAQCHMGHHTSSWNPANSRYIYGERSDIHIISLEVIAAHLRRAARVVEEVAYHGGLILLVGNRKGQMPIVTRMAELAGACHLFQKWTPGCITNKDVLLAGGQLKIVNERDEELGGFEEHLRDCRPVTPDLVVCLNPLENYTLLRECALATVPTVGIVDTDADPSWVTYQIPGNDDSLRSVALIAGVLGRAGERGQQRRLEDAKQGIVKWQTPRDVRGYIDKANSLAAEEAKAEREKRLAEGAVDESGLKPADLMTEDEFLAEMFGHGAAPSKY
ncbi:ribosomal protein S2, flavodoxin-like domain-containing protein [Apiosordaria backusii]|uniref:Ribosomal protein S2, flavodoxin-like domain-containing protein n=1 Tax=Apiosordaria backusii TaxID=314023 RepID=A0AA40ASJ9_9PEZI|nr:ribosomal protein S2, flavodoxin-like domain-containing protein [Apiosordaria backusii]